MISNNSSCDGTNVDDTIDSGHDDDIVRLILVDYDDTLICSTFISKQLSSSSSPPPPSISSSSILSQPPPSSSSSSSSSSSLSHYINEDGKYNDTNDYNSSNNNSNSNSNSNNDDDSDSDDDDDDDDDDEQWSHLKYLEQESIKLLLEASKHGKVIIISNAETAWIDYTLKAYFPSLASTMTQLSVEIVSARDKFIHLYPSHPLSWKIAGFRQEIHAHIHRHGIQQQNQHHHKPTRFIIMSIGDGMHEKIACETICNEIDKEHLTLKLFESPSPEVLHQQLSIVTENFSQLIYHSGIRASDGKLGKHLHLVVSQHGDLKIEENNNENSSRSSRRQRKNKQRSSSSNSSNSNNSNNSSKQHQRQPRVFEINANDNKDDDDTNYDDAKTAQANGCCVYWNCFKTP